MTSLTISLRGLKHPLTLASIGLLLLNDHVLKTAMPSPLTGKLSDLAGLFFFPFLLAALLSLPLDRLGIPARRTAALAFGPTGLCFTLIKTWPWANALAAETLAHLLGLPVQIVLDPTDLLALIVLWPAWRLWLRLEQKPSQPSSGKLAYLALGLASLATVATAPCMSIPRITRLVVFEQQIYTNLSQPGHSDLSFAVSQDGGRTWSYNWSNDPGPRIQLPADVAQKLRQPAQLPVVICEPQNPRTCYRITGALQIEASPDGGQTWQVIWQVPLSRLSYMQRQLARESTLQHCKATPDLGIYDLALLSHGGSVTLVAAMGDEGVLVRTPQGDWQRYAVSSAMPTPYMAETVEDVLGSLIGETALFLIMAVAAYSLSCFWLWRSLLSGADVHQRRSVARAVMPAAGAGIALLVGPIPTTIAFMALNNRLTPGLEWYWVAPILALGGPAITWIRMTNMLLGEAIHPRLVRQGMWGCALVALCIFPLAWLPLLLWTLGVIRAYEMALAISVIVGIVALIAGIWFVGRMGQLAFVRQDRSTARRMTTPGFAEAKRPRTFPYAIRHIEHAHPLPFVLKSLYNQAASNLGL